MAGFDELHQRLGSGRDSANHRREEGSGVCREDSPCSGRAQRVHLGAALHHKADLHRTLGADNYSPPAALSPPPLL